MIKLQLAMVAWAALQCKIVEAAAPLHPPVLPIDEQTGGSIDLSSLQQQRDCMNCYCLNYMNGYSIQGTVCAAYCFAVSDPTSCEFDDLVKLDEQLESLTHDDAQGTIIKRTSYRSDSSVMNLREGFLQVCKDIKSHIASNGACPRNINNFVGKYATAPTKMPTKAPSKSPTKRPTPSPTPYPTPYPTNPPEPCKHIYTSCKNLEHVGAPFCTNSAYPVHCGSTSQNCGQTTGGDPLVKFKCCNRSGC